MNKALINYEENGIISIEAHGTKPVRMKFYTTGPVLNAAWDNMLFENENLNAPIIATLVNGIETMLQKKGELHFDNGAIQAKDVCKIEISDGSGKVLSTVVNEVVN